MSYKGLDLDLKDFHEDVEGTKVLRSSLMLSLCLLLLDLRPVVQKE